MDVPLSADAAAARLKSEQELTLRILEAIPGGIVHVAADGAILHANPEALRVLGLRLDELTQRYTADFAVETINEDGSACPAEDYPITRALLSGKAQPEQVIGVRRPDGDVAWAIFRAVPVMDPTKNEVAGAVATFLDITDRRRTQQALAQSEARYRQLVEASPEPIAIVQKGKLVYVNHAGSTLLGHGSSSDMVGRAVTEFVVEDRRAELDEYVRGRMAGKLQGFVDTQLKTKNGDVIYSEISAGLGSHEGKRAMLFVVRDVGKRKRAEQEIARLRSQIAHDQKLESLGLMAGGVAHDFNNLLAAIAGNASLAKIQIEPGSDAAESLDAIETATRRAADLTGQMLTYAGRGTVHFGPVNLIRVVSDILDLLSTVVSKRARLKIDLAADLPTVEGDTVQLRQVVMNLIMNASDALAGAPGKITITARVVDKTRDELKDTYVDDDLPAGSYVCMEVADTGTGMPKETTARVFDPFFSTKTTGRGLGLAATLGIVRSHRSAIELSSEEGKGTTFRVFLPVSGREQPASEPPAQVEAGLRGGTLLVIDDEPAVLDVACSLLTEFGYKVIGANSGREGLSEYRRGRGDIDAVVLDMTMPDMTGGEVLDELRSMDPSVRVVLCSGYTEEDVAIRLGTAQAAAFLQKPYSAAALVGAVEKSLKS